MSLGSRIASRGQAAVRASLTSIPREPLLFLYPAWVRKSSTAASPKAVSSQSIDIPPDSHESSHAARRKTRHSSNETAASHASTTKNNTEDGLGDFSVNNVVDSKAHSGAKTAPTRSHSVFSAKFDSKTDSDSTAGDKVTNKPSRNTVEMVLYLADKAKDDEFSRRMSRKEYQTARALATHAWHADWRVILADLRSSTSQHGPWLNQAVLVRVPDHSLEQLFTGLDDTLWDIGAAHDCTIEIGPRDPDLVYRTFYISGSATAISKATSDILRVAPDVKIRASRKKLADVSLGAALSAARPEDYPARHMYGRFRAVIRTPQPVARRLPAHKIPKPNRRQMNPHSFHGYVCRLIYSEVPNHVRGFMYERGDEHVSVVAEILSSLFADPENRPLITRAACKEAMSYFVKCNQIDRARTLHAHMEAWNMRMDPAVFNYMLRGAAKNEDLHTFHFILHMMLRKGCFPNAETWILFLSTVTDIRIRMQILTAMRDKGLLQQSRAIRRICEILAVPELESSLDKGESEESFLAHMDSRYGPDWLSLNTGNQILNILGSRGLISRCWDFMAVMESRHTRPNTYSVNTILHHCKLVKNPKGALAIMQGLPYNSIFCPDEETYRILFEIAWQARSFNMARVVWRYACMSAATTHSMRERVAKSLRADQFQDSGKRLKQAGKRFKAYAGEFIIGRQQPGSHPMEFFLGKMSLKTPEEDKLTWERLIDQKLAELEASSELVESSIESMKAVIEDTSKEVISRHNDKQTTADSNTPSNPLQVTNGNAQQSINHFATLLQEAHPLSKLARRRRARLLIEHDLGVFKDWEATEPFREMLSRAFELDEVWKAETVASWRKKDVLWMLKHAMHVPLQRRHGQEKGYAWELVWT